MHHAGGFPPKPYFGGWQPYCSAAWRSVPHMSHSDLRDKDLVRAGDSALILVQQVPSGSAGPGQRTLTLTAGGHRQVLVGAHTGVSEHVVVCSDRTSSFAVAAAEAE